LKEYLEDELAVARLLNERRWADLLAVVRFVETDVDPELAVTDPALYKVLRDAITKFYMRGYGCLDASLLQEKVTAGSRLRNNGHHRCPEGI